VDENGFTTGANPTAAGPMAIQRVKPVVAVLTERVARRLEPHLQGVSLGRGSWKPQTIALYL
jgi:hypothetical protein